MRDSAYYKAPASHDELEKRLKEAEKEYKKTFKPDKNGLVDLPF